MLSAIVLRGRARAAPAARAWLCSTPVEVTPEQAQANSTQLRAASRALTPDHAALPPAAALVGEPMPPAAEATVLNKAPPPAVKDATAVIKRPSPWATQSTARTGYHWEVTWPDLNETWTNHLMGWSSTGDPMSNMRLKFETEAAAVAFCENNGYSFRVDDVPQDIDIEPKFYGHNFLPARVESRVRSQGHRVPDFNKPTENASHFQKYQTYHGDGLVAQHGGEAADHPESLPAGAGAGAAAAAAGASGAGKKQGKKGKKGKKN